MVEREVPKLLSFFSDIEDPRRATGNKRHLLEDILCIAICAVISGADSFTEIEQYGLAKEEWFKGFLRLPNRIPSHDTFNRVFAVLDKDAWQRCFLDWVRSLELPKKQAPTEVIAVDGKSARRSHSKEMAALHTVSVWAREHALVLGAEQVLEKSNEITVIPVLLETLSIAGATVTIDAMGCQKDIAWAVREHHADYLLALKQNHPTLFEDVCWLFEQHPGEPHWRTTDKGHGRKETRECWLLTDLSFLDEDERRLWRDVRAVVKLRCTRQVADKVSLQERYYLTSLTDVEQVAYAARGHWGIENGLHWVLDMAFREDESRVRSGNAQANLVTLRHLALSLLKREQSLKVGVKAKRMRAGWDMTYLKKVLNA